MSGEDDAQTHRAHWLWATGLAAVLVIGALVGVTRWGSVSSKPAGGSIELSEVTATLAEDNMTLGASAAIDLSATIQTGLDNGVPLTFIMDVRLLRSRKWWFDQTLARFQNRYTLTYYELTRHYRVLAVQTNISQNYRSLSSALAGLGRFEAIVFDFSEAEELQLRDKTGLIAAAHLKLDTTALPLPLQPLVRSSWKLASEEHRWPVI